MRRADAIVALDALGYSIEGMANADIVDIVLAAAVPPNQPAAPNQERIDAANAACAAHFGDSYIPHGSMEDGFVDGFLAGADLAQALADALRSLLAGIEAATEATYATMSDEIRRVMTERGITAEKWRELDEQVNPEVPVARRALAAWDAAHP